MDNEAVKSKRGGPRPGSGAKPISNKKIPVTIYVRKSVIEKLGGVEKVKEMLRERAGG